MKAKKYYAYLVPGGARGVVDEWSACERMVKGVQGARYRGFPSRSEAEVWLGLGAPYEAKPPRERRALLPGIYFDAGTGRGKGVEIRVTDARGADLLHTTLPAAKINKFGTHRLSPASTNNYGELLAAKYALQIAIREGITLVAGDSKLIVEYWSRGHVKKDMPKRTRDLAEEVAELRKAHEVKGGEVALISGDDNPADLGFHR
jgi:ribonuclease H-related protein